MTATLPAMESEQARQALPRLLDLQAEDTAIQRLTDRRASLPEAERLSDLRDQLAELEADLEIARKQHEEIARECNRFEGEIELLETKLAREEQRMFSGAVSNPKELSALQAEVEMLKNKRSGLEDQLLEAMEQRDSVAATVAGHESERSEISGTVDELGAAVQSLSGDIDSELAARTSQRGSIASEIPPDLLALYEKLRAEKHGVGAAALEGGVCLGCHTKLPAKEVERVRFEGGLQRCDNCRRILIVA